MRRREFIPGLLTAAAAAAWPVAVHAADAADVKIAPQRRRRRGGMMANPRFERLSFEGKRLIEYARTFLRKVPRPGPGILREYLLTYDDLSVAEQTDLARVLRYVEYMTPAELRRYVGVPDGQDRMPRQQVIAALRAFAREPRIPYHTGAKLVVTAFGPWDDRTLPTAPPDAHLLPHVARDLMPAGTWYAHVTGGAAALPAWTRQVLQAGRKGRRSESIAASLMEAGRPRTAVWSVLGAGTGVERLTSTSQAPYLLTTAEAKVVDEYLGGRGLRERIRAARAQEDRKAVRQALTALAEQAMIDLRLAERYPDPQAQQFIKHVLFRERGVKDRGNTFVHVGALRTMQLAHPTFLYTQFGGPDEALRSTARGKTFGEQASVGRGDYSDADYLADLDQWSYYHWLEAQQHPHYAGEATFVLLFGPSVRGRTQALVSGPDVAAGTRVTTPVALHALLGDALRPIV